MSIEDRYITDTPNAEQGTPPPNLSLVAEDVVEGLKLALRHAERQRPENHDARQSIIYARTLDKATTIFVRFLESLSKIDQTPLLRIAENIQTYRLGKLMDGGYALFEGPASLKAGESYPINYWKKHRILGPFSQRDIVLGSMEEEQLYLGYAPSSVRDMDGYAISLNHFMMLSQSSAAWIDTEPMARAN